MISTPFRRRKTRCLAGLFAMGLLIACEQTVPIPRYAESDRGGDQDGDGAPDLDDACPEAPEDGLAPKANDGCPDTDTDEDGVMLADDSCPDAKEDGEAPNPVDGCPVKDSDSDGVSDNKDKCPDQAEDNIGPQKSDGCLAIDTDKDGIADERDRCPAEAEVLNGYRDADGCPDQAPAGDVAYDEESHEIWIAEGKKLSFEPNAAELTPASAAFTVEIAKVLNAHPEISRLEIEVHSTGAGEEKQNVDLTQRRADKLKASIVKNGVMEGRLVPIGYGEYCPAIDSKGDATIDLKNERVHSKTVVVKNVWQPVVRGCFQAKAKGIDPTKRGIKKKAPIVVPSPGV